MSRLFLIVAILATMMRGGATAEAWKIHSFIEPVLVDEQASVGEAQLTWSKARNRLEIYYGCNQNKACIRRASLVGKRWEREVNPVIGRGAGGVATLAARTGLVALPGQVWVTWCDLSTTPTGLIGAASADETGFSFSSLNGNVLPATDGVAWTRLNLCRANNTDGAVIGLAEALYEGKWQVFGVSAPMPDNAYTVLNGGVPLATLCPIGCVSFCSGRITKHSGYFETSFHAGDATGLTEIYHGLSLDGIAWFQVQKMVGVNDVPKRLGRWTRQLADVTECYCPEGHFIAFTQVDSSFESRIVVMREER